MTFSRIRENSEGAMIQPEVSRLRLRKNDSLKAVQFTYSSGRRTVLMMHWLLLDSWEYRGMACLRDTTAATYTV